jgi:hypothetical protein
VWLVVKRLHDYSSRPRFSTKILFTITVRMEDRNSTPNVESERHMSVELATTPHIARIESAVAGTLLTILTVKQILLMESISPQPRVPSIESSQVATDNLTAVLGA